MIHLTLPLSFLILSLYFLPSSSSSSSSIRSPDSSALLSFKSSSDPLGLLASWSPSTDPCSGSWIGVSSCNSNGRITHLVLENLSLNGTLQPLSLLPHLSLLSLKNNSLSDPLHLLNLSLWQPHLKLLYLSKNHFSGAFPQSILLLRHLRRLDLAGNLLSSSIPPDIGFLLSGLITLRIEHNHINGEIPSSIGEIRGLVDLNVSYNNLVGEIPKKISSFPASSFIRNTGLCGKPFTDRGCPEKDIPEPGRSKNKSSTRWVEIVFLIAIVGVGLGLLVAFFFGFKKRRERRKREGKEESGGKESEVIMKGKDEKLVFFQGCREFVMEDMMRGSAEILGRGVVGSTYRVLLLMEGGDGGEVVVKRVRKERKEVEDEGILREIGRWRHPNVVSLLAYYLSDEELLLVFEYVPRGSLHNLLYGNRGPGRIPLDWPTRFNLALTAAKGLHFLHEKSSKSKLSHHNLTSSNILITEDNTALISDFALHHLITPPNLTRNPPRSPESDVYSFGVVLLEILTGRTEGEGDRDLVRWVEIVVREEWTSEVFDIEISRGKETENEMVALLQVGLLCSTRDPKQRPKMSNVVKMIEDVKERRHNSSEISPGLSDDTAVTFTSS